MSLAVMCWALAALLVLVPGAPGRCLAQSDRNSSVSTHQGAVSSPLVRTTDFLQRLADARVFSGTVAVQKGGSIVFTGGYGYALEELYVPMKAEYMFPIGSQSKFFTTVAINQLAKQGYLSISDPAAKHLDPADFPALQGKPWCPRVHGNETLGCQNVTVEHLLTMASGIFPQDMGDCDGVPPSEEWTGQEWYYPYRVTAVGLTYGDAQGVNGQLHNGSDRLAGLVNRIKVLEMPLLFAPSEGWCYEDANYNVLGYMVEKYSNMSLADYIHKHVLEPANLTDTLYWNGAPGEQPSGLRHQMLPVPAYVAEFSGAGPYSFNTSRRWFGWTGEIAFSVGAAGSMFSTAADSLKWFMTFLTRPEVLQLSRADINSMITPKFKPFYYSNGTVRPCTEDALLFAQGMSTFGSPNAGHGIEFTGSQWAFTVNTRIWTNDGDVARSDGVTVFSNYTPHIPKGQNCTVVSLVDNSAVNLDSMACGFTDDDSGDLTLYIQQELASIWNITGMYPPPNIPTNGG